MREILSNTCSLRDCVNLIRYFFLGALDGSHIPIDRPKEDQRSYYNRKCYHSIQLQAVVNHKSKFIHVFIGYPGSVHDVRVFGESDLMEELHNLCNGLYAFLLVIRFILIFYSSLVTFYSR